MARARNIKPAFFQNEDLVELDPILRLFFIALWTIADRNGRLEYRPKRIKMQLFPADELDISSACTILARYNFIRVYVHENIKYIEIINFCKHQNPHQNEPACAPESDGCTILAPEDYGTDPAYYLLPITESLLPNNAHSDARPSEKANGKSKAEAEKRFSEFWQGYPRKKDKKKAHTAFLRLSANKQRAAIADIQQRYANVNQSEVKFIPYPTTYIRGERWDDEQDDKLNGNDIMKGLI